MRYKVHKIRLNMSEDKKKLEDYLNNLKGDVISILPNVTWFPKTQVDFIYVVEKAA